MKLRKLEIRHKEYYSDNPKSDVLEGTVEFFNDKGQALQIKLEQRHMEGILSLCASALNSAAKEACEAIRVQTSLLIEGV